MNLTLLASGEAHKPPVSIFTPIWNWFKDTDLGRWYGFDTMDRNLGQFWFEAIGFSIIVAGVLILCSFIATRSYARVPRGIQNVFEWIVQLLRNLVNGVIGKDGDKYVPYLGTVFLFIFTMNLCGLVPFSRSPTMTLSTTAALGITTFVMVQSYAIRATGFVAYIKHFMGPMLLLAPLMLVVEFVGELARPVSLSLRLYGNIFGEDNVIEKLMELGAGAYIPLQFPMLLFAIFTSFLQAFIFTMLASIYIATKVEHGDDHGHEAEHAQGAHHA